LLLSGDEPRSFYCVKSSKKRPLIPKDNAGILKENMTLGYLKNKGAIKGNTKLIALFVTS
jgi:hypothetical protein